MRRLLVTAAAALVLTFAGSEPLARDGRPTVAGRVLVAGPEMGDPNFARTVVYMAVHDRDGALGVVVNRPGRRTELQTIFEGFGLAVPDSLDHTRLARTVRVLAGGPVEITRGALLHTSDWSDPTTETPDGPFALSFDIGALAGFSDDSPPRRYAVVLGYAGWAPGQLDSEIDRGNWLVAPADEDLVFGDDPADVWQRALSLAGLDT